MTYKRDDALYVCLNYGEAFAPGENIRKKYPVDAKSRGGFRCERCVLMKILEKHEPFVPDIDYIEIPY